MLDLATSRAGITRLVTTNFDLLFEECDPSLPCSGPPRLPDPRNDRDFRGIVASATQPEEAGLRPPDASWLAQIEQLVGDLAMAVERGDVRADRVFKGRIRAVADRLLTLVGDNDRGALN